jgi:hypothetical protein
MIVIMPYFLSWHPTKSYHRVTIELFICCLLGPISLCVVLLVWSLIFNGGPWFSKKLRYRQLQLEHGFNFILFSLLLLNLPQYTKLRGISPSIVCLCLLVPYKYKVLYGLKLIDIYEFKRFQTTPSIPNVCRIWLLHQL